MRKEIRLLSMLSRAEENRRRRSQGAKVRPMLPRAPRGVGSLTPSEFFKWLAIEFDSWEGWDRFRTHEGEENIQKIEWFEVSEHMEVDYSDVVDEILEVETICLCCGQRPEACDNNGLSLP